MKTYSYWKPKHLTVNPFPPRTPERELWGWDFLDLVDALNLVLPIPRPDPPVPPVDAIMAQFTAHYGDWSTRTMGSYYNSALFEPFNVFPPEWAEEGASPKYQLFKGYGGGVYWDARVHEPAQAQNPYGAGNWQTDQGFPAPSAEGLLWQREYNHFRRNALKHYVDPYGPGQNLRRSGLPFERFVPVWDAHGVGEWTGQSMQLSPFTVDGQLWTDERVRWNLNGGPAAKNEVPVSVLGKVQNPPRRPFPTTISEMRGLIGTADGAPVSTLPSYEAVINGGVRVADFGDLEVWSYDQKIYLISVMAKAVLGAGQ